MIPQSPLITTPWRNRRELSIKTPSLLTQPEHSQRAQTECISETVRRASCILCRKSISVQPKRLTQILRGFRILTIRLFEFKRATDKTSTYTQKIWLKQKNATRI